MLYTVENERIKLTVSELGAEIVSLILKETNTEYIWQGNAEYWAGHAYNLFPICGRLFENKYTYKNKTYEMNQHGFSRRSTHALKEQTENSLTFSLTDSDTTYKQYPFRFELNLKYTIKDSSVTTSFHIENKDEKELIFAIGSHPGFNVPLSCGEEFNDYYISFDEKCDAKLVNMSERCFLTGTTSPYKLRCQKSFPLSHEMFDNDAIFLTDVYPAVTLKSKKSKHFVSLSYSGFKYLGFWHKPKSNAPYICIEPWSSMPSLDGKIDDLETKADMFRLLPNESFDASFTVSIG